MTSRSILIVHTAIFSSFVLGSLSTPILARYFSDFFASWYYLPSSASLMALVMASWKKFGGCPFTVWENRFREIESQGSAYLGSCLTHYSQKWLGLKIPNIFFTILLISLLILPNAVGILERYILD